MSNTKKTIGIIMIVIAVILAVHYLVVYMTKPNYTKVDVLTEEYYNSTDFGKSSSLTLEELKLPENREVYMLYLFYCVDESISLSTEYKTDTEFTASIKIADTDELPSTEQWDKLSTTNYKVKSIMFDKKNIVLSTVDATHINPVDGYLVLDETMLKRLCFE